VGKVMKRPLKARGKAGKAGRKAARPQRPTAPGTASKRPPNGSVQEIEIARLTRERDEALEQQTATSKVLHVISSSPADLARVFEAILTSAMKICEAKFGLLFRFDGTDFQIAASFGAPPTLDDYFRQLGPFKPWSTLDRLLRTKDVVRITDALADPDPPPSARLAGARSHITVPMFMDKDVVGAIAIYRQQVRPFTDKQVDLVKNFAAQAVIAIENARLLNELRQRTADLSESLEQQTATSEVLSVISSSPGELDPVFKTILENATRICEAQFGHLFRFRDGAFHIVATHNMPPAFEEFLRRGPIQPSPSMALMQVVRSPRTVQVDDVRKLEGYIKREPLFVAGAELGGVRTLLTVPMVKDEALVGVISIYRQEVRPFTDKQIALVTNFAAQAVIAIENTRLLNELRQSLQQQTATADVLKVISRSTFDLQTVLQTLIESAAKLCDADQGVITRSREGVFYRAEAYGYSKEFMNHVRNVPVEPGRGTVLGRALSERKVVQIPDVQADPEWTLIEAQRLGNFRTVLGVPMLREGMPIGVFALTRSEVRPFTDKQIELVTTFADQAVIAIENARLLNELRQRTSELTETLEQQTAASEVLKVISSSPGDLQPVFQVMLENATRICDAKFGNIYRWEGGLHFVASNNTPPAFAEVLRQEAAGKSAPTNSVVARMIAGKSAIHISDLTADEGYSRDRVPMTVAAVELGGVRTVLAVPMLKDGELVGGLMLNRDEVRPFTDKQVELVTNFAAQAVIAIENARLLNELRESLEQQTATSEVLKVISSSPANIEPVLDIICERAEKLCDAETSTVCIVEGELIRGASIHGETEVGVEATRGLFPMRLTDETVAARAIRTRSVCHVADVLSDPQYQQKHAARLRGIRGALAVPMVRGDQVVGAIFVARRQLGLFSDAQVQLLKTFADQAVIAIENVRLFNETKNSLEQQTATADVLKIISRSAFDLRAVLQTLVESAARFCNADKANIIREKDGGFYTAEAYGYSHEFMDYMKNIPIKPERGSASGRALLEGRVVHIADVKADSEYTLVEAPRLGDFRTILCVPMMREGVPIGLLVLTRSEVQPFTDKQIELVTTFADQAAIAIENVRLFDEIQDKSRQLEEASQHKSQFLANMSHELRTPLNAILGYTELMADGAYGEPSEKMLGILKRLEANGRHLLGLINDVLDLSKIEAGQLELELSDYCVQDIAQTVRSTLEPLAADKKLAFKVEVAPELPPGRGDGRRLTQVLINLVGNAIKFTDAGEVAIKAEANNGAFHVSVRDTGPGISATDQARLFQEFQQADNAITRKKGGTGLGLAISKRIIEMHGGRIWVESQLGQGSTFTFMLPVVVERQAETA
jgi:GAF domain-containing protein